MTPDEQRAEYTERISNAALVQHLSETPGYAFLREWLEANLDSYDRALKDTAFVDDHNGYLNARALFVAYKNVIEFIEGTISDGDRARRDLDELDKTS